MRIVLTNPKKNQSGMAVILVIAILSILFIFVAGNLRTLYLLRTDLRFIETQQTNRLSRASFSTNLSAKTITAPVDKDATLSVPAQTK